MAKLREILNKLTEFTPKWDSYEVDQAISDIQKLMLSEIELRQIISGNKVPGGYTQQQADLAQALHTAQQKKVNDG